VDDGKKVSPLALAFVAGYASDKFFHYLDRLVESLFPSRPPSATGGTDGEGISGATTTVSPATTLGIASTASGKGTALRQALRSIGRRRPWRCGRPGALLNGLRKRMDGFTVPHGGKVPSRADVRSTSKAAIWGQKVRMAAHGRSEALER